MKITVLSEIAKLSFAKALFRNECGGKQSLVYVWSDADGVRTGKSGYSCGLTQMDINNNPNALLLLRDLGYTTDEVKALRAQDPALDMNAMNAKLLAARDVVDKWDRKQISECLSWPLQLCNDINVDFKDEEAFIHVADYHNQFGMSRGGKMYVYLRDCHKEVTGEMIRDFKYTLPYGIAQRQKDRDHDDVWRRYYNIVQLMREEA